MKRVVSIRYGQVHYHAGCNQCDFSTTITIEGRKKSPADVRAEVRAHVLKTGHQCWIEAGTHTDYRLEEDLSSHLTSR